MYVDIFTNWVNGALGLPQITIAVLLSVLQYGAALGYSSESATHRVPSKVFLVAMCSSFTLAISCLVTFFILLFWFQPPWIILFPTIVLLFVVFWRLYKKMASLLALGTRRKRAVIFFCFLLLNVIMIGTTMFFVELGSLDGGATVMYL